MEENKAEGCRKRECPRGKIQVYNWLGHISGTDDSDLVMVQFKNTRYGFYRNVSNLPLKEGDTVVVEAQPGYDVGQVVMTGRLVEIQLKKSAAKDQKDIKKIYRLAKESDLEKFREARSREHETMIKSRKIAESLDLKMKIGDVEYQGDGIKAIFYYIADERVDFRKLIRLLADEFHIRVEMKQIGARQEAGRIGGIGPCGRPLCCATWMNHFVSVGTSAARFQDLSMNPQKLAGQCAKLKCCLNYEVDVYMEASKKMPSKEAHPETKDCTWYLFKSDTLAGKLTYSTDKHIPANLVTIDAARAFEVLALNKQGIKPETLDVSADEAGRKKSEFVEIVGQDDLTRFDKSKKKKKKDKKRVQKKSEEQETQPSSKPQPQGQKNKKPKFKKQVNEGGQRNEKAAPKE